MDIEMNEDFSNQEKEISQENVIIEYSTKNENEENSDGENIPKEIEGNDLNVSISFNSYLKLRTKKLKKIKVKHNLNFLYLIVKIKEKKKLQKKQKEKNN